MGDNSNTPCEPCVSGAFISLSRGTVCRDVTCRARSNCRKPLVSLHPSLFLAHKEDLDTYLCQRCRDITCLCEATCTHTRTERHQHDIVAFSVAREIATICHYFYPVLVCLESTLKVPQNTFVFEPANVGACWRSNLFCA